MTRSKLRTPFIAGSLALMIAISGCSAQTTSAVSGNNNHLSFTSEEVEFAADYLEYESLSEASASSSIVVIGTPLSSESKLLYPTISDSKDPLLNPQAGLSESEMKEFMEQAGVPITVTKFRIDEVIGGDAKPGEIIEVQQDGGKIETVSYREGSTTLLSEIDINEQKILLNLKALPDKFTPINPTQGVVAVQGEKLVPFGGVASTETFKALKSSLNSK